MSWSELQAEPAFGFTVVALIIVFGPLLAEKLRLPGLLGLLVMGAVVGPNVVDLLPSFDALEAIGDIGVLYLIFLSGLQLDLDAFRRNWRVSAGFGALTSVFPLVLGTVAALVADIDMNAAILIGSFWASYTLVAYPIIAKYGLAKNRAVSAIVGGSSITDTVSLVILALIVGAETGDVGGARLVVDLTIGFVVLALYCFVAVPWIARWFFMGLGQERTLRFMLVLASLTSAAVVADAVGVEPLIGAFFVGVGLNRSVPNASPLMAVTEFFGNAFFIPAFLVSVGLLFDPEVMIQGSTLRLAIGFLAALVVGKAVAALVSGRVFRLDSAEVGLMFSVSVAQAAATLAATIVGLQAGLFGDDVVNAVMVVVSVSLIITSLGTERFAPRVVAPTEDRQPVGSTVLVPVEGDAASMRALLELADEIATPRGGVVRPIVLATSSDVAAVAAARTAIVDTDRMLLALGRDDGTILRLDRSIAAGVQRAAVESNASLLLLDWLVESDDIRSWLFGGSESEILGEAAVPSAAAALRPGGWKRVVLVARGIDRLPGRVNSLLVAAELAAELSDRDRPLLVGPLTPDVLKELGCDLPEETAHIEPSSAVDWLETATRPGDLVIQGTVLAPDRRLLALHSAGRSVIAVSHNPASETRLTGSSLAFPVGGSINPA